MGVEGAGSLCLCCWKSTGKGKQIHKSQNIAKMPQIVPWALELTAVVSRCWLCWLCWLTFNWTMQFAQGARCPFHPGLLGPALPCPQRRLLTRCIRSSSCSGFSSFCSAGGLGTSLIRSSAPCTPEEQRVAALTCRACQLHSSPASPGAGAPPPGAVLGAAGAPVRTVWVILVFQGGLDLLYRSESQTPGNV